MQKRNHPTRPPPAYLCLHHPTQRLYSCVNFGVVIWLVASDEVLNWERKKAPVNRDEVSLAKRIPRVALKRVHWITTKLWREFSEIWDVYRVGFLEHDDVFKFPEMKLKVSTFLGLGVDSVVLDAGATGRLSTGLLTPMRLYIHWISHFPSSLLFFSFLFLSPIAHLTL